MVFANLFNYLHTKILKEGVSYQPRVHLKSPNKNRNKAPLRYNDHKKFLSSFVNMIFKFNILEPIVGILY